MIKSDLITKFTNVVKAHWAIFFLCLLLIIVKIQGASWGFPEFLHSDEKNLINSSLGMRFGDLNPQHFDWPSLSFYIHYALFLTLIKVRVAFQLLFGVETMQQALPFWWGPEMPFLLLGRLASIFLTALASGLVYAIALKIGNKSKLIALTAALVYSVGFWTNFHSFYALPEPLLIVFMLLSFYFSLKIIEFPQQISNYVLAALFAGFATSTKYHGCLLCVVLLSAHLMNNPSWKAFFDKKLILAAIVALVAFFVGTPYAFLDAETFLGTKDATGALWQIGHMGKGLNWGYHLFEAIPQNFGWPLALIGFYGILVSIVSKNKLILLNLIAFMTMLLYIGTWGITRSHYAIVFFPMFSVFVALALNAIKTRFKLSTRLFALLLLALLIFPLSSSCVEIYRRSREDTVFKRY